MAFYEKSQKVKADVDFQAGRLDLRV